MQIELVMASRLADILGSMNELFIEVTQEEDGGFCAECLSENIFTQGDDWDAMRRNVQEAVRAYYFDQPQAPKRIRLRLIRDELLACA
jgi:predicted RNase H-like HicB family nuclease